MPVSRFALCSWKSRLFRWVRKIAKSDNELRHVCLSEWNNSAPTYRFLWTLMFEHFTKKLSGKFKFLWNLTRKTDILDHWTFLIVSRSVLFRMRNISYKSCRGNQNTFCVQQLFFSSENRAHYETVWKNIVERGRPEMTIWRKRISFWITKAAHTHTHTHTHTNTPHTQTNTPHTHTQTHHTHKQTPHTHTHTHTQM